METHAYRVGYKSEVRHVKHVKSTGKYWLNFVFLTSRDKNKMCSYVIRSTRHPSQSQRPGPATTDSPREVWWTVSHNYTVLLLCGYSLKFSCCIYFIHRVVVKFSYAWMDVQTKYRRQRIGKLIAKQIRSHKTYIMSIFSEWLRRPCPIFFHVLSGLVYD